MPTIPFRIIIAAAIVAWPSAALAQKGQQIFDLFLQGAQQELYRQQHLEHERQRRQELNSQHQSFISQWHACFQEQLAACEQALAYPYLNFNDRQRLITKRADIIAVRKAAVEQARREAQQAERHRERELHAERDRERIRDQELARLRDEAERQRQRSEPAERERQAVRPNVIATVVETQALQQRQPEQPQIALWLWIALVLAMVAIVSVLTYFRATIAPSMRVVRDQILQWQSSLAAHIQRVPRQQQAEAQSDFVVHDGPQPSQDATRDTIGAIAAMELAYAFIEEIRAVDMPGLEDKEARRHHLNTLALASRQLDAAEKLDPDAVLEGENEKDIPYRFTISELKSEALLLEGLTHQVYDLRRAVPALVAATKANPSNARAFYALGLTHAANRNKPAAVAAFRSAVALDPKNITFRKELSRAESLSAAEIAGYKATRAGERIYDAGIATANAGIMAWNVFAVLWNIATFPLRMVVAIFRLLRLHPFA